MQVPWLFPPDPSMDLLPSPGPRPPPVRGPRPASANESSQVPLSCSSKQQVVRAPVDPLISSLFSTLSPTQLGQDPCSRSRSAVSEEAPVCGRTEYLYVRSRRVQWAQTTTACRLSGGFHIDYFKLISRFAQEGRKRTRHWLSLVRLWKQCAEMTGLSGEAMPGAGFSPNAATTQT